MSSLATTLSDQMLTWLKSHEEEMFRLLESIVNIDSGSHCKRGVDRVNAVLRESLQSSGITSSVLDLKNHGDCLLAEVPGSDTSNLPHALLLGHMDTVFPEGTAAARPYSVLDGVAHGPGVADMKSGLVMNVFVARAFAEIEGNRGPVRILFTSDEEIASPSSRPFILEYARGAHTVLNPEAGRPNGNVVTERKGAFFIDFEVQGIAAHSGVAHHAGASAIDALARKILALHALTDPATGITSNVGIVSGGVSANTVAPYASAKLDVRFPNGVDVKSLHRKIHSIIEEESVPSTHGLATWEGSFSPLFQTAAGRDLLTDYIEAAMIAGLSVSGESTGGSADSGLTASVGAPTLCATGPIGGNVHTEKEYCLLSTIVPRALASALTVLKRDSCLRQDGVP